MSKTTIYFLRHGEVHNPKKILYGRLPGFHLSCQGQKRIKNVAGQFTDKDINYLYSSPMLRARQTANILAERLKLTIKISRLLNEVKLIFAGLPLEEFRSRFQPDLYSQKNVTRGQESIEAISQRMSRFLNLIIRRHPGKKILVVSHGDPIVILRAKTLSMDFTWHYKKANYLQTGEWFTLIFRQGKYSWK